MPIDGVRRIVNRFRGRLGIAVAAELHLRGAEALLIHGDGAFPVPSFVPHRVARTYDDYRAHGRRGARPRLRGGRVLGRRSPTTGPQRPAAGKIPSGKSELELTLVPTAKIIEEVRQAHPGLYMVTFKYQEGLAHEELMDIARARLESLPLRGGEPRRGAGREAAARVDADPRRASHAHRRQARASRRRSPITWSGARRLAVS